MRRASWAAGAVGSFLLLVLMLVSIGPGAGFASPPTGSATGPADTDGPPRAFELDGSQASSPRLPVDTSLAIPPPSSAPPREASPSGADAEATPRRRSPGPPSSPPSIAAASAAPALRPATGDLDLPPGESIYDHQLGDPIYPAVGVQARPDVAAVDIHDGPGGRVVRTLTNPFGPQQSYPAFGVIEAEGPWLHVDLPTRPNGSRGWVRAELFNVFRTVVSVDVDLSARVMTVYREADVVRSLPVTVGAPDSPTPTGTFYVSDLVPEPGGSYGSYAFGLSAHSDVHLTFAGGDGQVAIHGTDRPDLMGTAASDGCIRVPNGVATALADLMTIGVRVRVHE